MPPCVQDIGDGPVQDLSVCQYNHVFCFFANEWNSHGGSTKEVVFWAPRAELKIHGPSFNESKVYRSPIAR